MNHLPQLSQSIPNELVDYINDHILPQYDAFDKAHQRQHALSVIHNSLEMAEQKAINSSMALVIAAYHDLGLCNGRERHHIDSGVILLADEKLRTWFTEEELVTMQEAIEDHRASNNHEPRTIYGKIVAEADRLIDGDVTLRRTVQFGLSHHPELGKEEQFKRFLHHLNEKYAEGGYLKLWIEPSQNAQRLADLRAIIADPVAVRQAFEKIYKEETEK